jgi:hypothetical protein
VQDETAGFRFRGGSTVVVDSLVHRVVAKDALAYFAQSRIGSSGIPIAIERSKIGLTNTDILGGRAISAISSSVSLGGQFELTASHYWAFLVDSSLSVICGAGCVLEGPLAAFNTRSHLYFQGDFNPSGGEDSIELSDFSTALFYGTMRGELRCLWASDAVFPILDSIHGVVIGCPSSATASSRSEADERPRAIYANGEGVDDRSGFDREPPNR